MKNISKVQLGQRIAVVLLAAAAIVGGTGYYFRPVVHAEDPPAFTPGMLFGPLSVDRHTHLKVCFSYLSPGAITASVHFRNLSTGEVTTAQSITINSGGGGCASYQGTGVVVGLARGEGAAADWVSPSNALISTMSLLSNNNGEHDTLAVVLGVAKIWVRGL